LLERTGYTLDVTTGQRKYGGPPPDSVYSGVQPGIGTEVFVGKIPRDLYEDELVPLFEKAGPIWDLRLMMDPLSGQNRGYAFITFCGKEAAQEAVKLVCDKQIPLSSGKSPQLKMFAVNIVSFSLVFFFAWLDVGKVDM